MHLFPGRFSSTFFLGMNGGMVTPISRRLVRPSAKFMLCTVPQVPHGGRSILAREALCTSVGNAT